MKARMLCILLGIVINVFTSSFGMVREAISEKVEACLLVQGEIGGDDDSHAALAAQGSALVVEAEGGQKADNAESGGKDRKRASKRTDSQKVFFCKPLSTKSLVAQCTARLGAPRPERAEAREQLAEMIRWLQLEALDC